MLAPAGTCADDPTWVPRGSAHGCTNAYDDAYDDAQGTAQGCDFLIAAGYATCANFLPGGPPLQGHIMAGYCDRSCHGGTCDGCATLDPCTCDQVSGLKNCPEVCLGYCAAAQSADRAQHPKIIQATAQGVTPAPVMGNIVDSVCPSGSAGLHEWFRFTAVAGFVYQINTEIVPGGLLSTWLHLHVLDDDNTELLAAKAWHCAGPAVGGASCISWACTADGDYGVRVARYTGSGAFKVAVQDLGTVGDLASREGLAPLISTTNPDKGVWGVGTGPGGDWSIAMDVQCSLLFCNFFRKTGTYTPGVRDGTAYTAGYYTAPNSGLQQTQMTSDGERVVMTVLGHIGATYTFNLDLLDPSHDGVYVKLTVHPDKAQGGAEAFSGDADMEREIKLGDWDRTQPGDHNYEESYPDYDIREYRNPSFGDWQCVGSCGVSPDGMSDQYARAGHWKWTAPADGRFFVTITSNCDVPVLDDIEANIDMQASPPHERPGHEGSQICQSSFGMSLHVEDEQTTLILPLILPLPPCATETGSDCQRGQNTQTANSQPVLIQTLTDTRVACSCLTAVPPTCATCDPADATQVATDLCAPNGLPATYTPEAQQQCADMVMMFTPAIAMLAPLPALATAGHRRQLQGRTHHHTMNPGSNQVEHRGSNVDAVQEMHRQAQLAQCARASIQPLDCITAIGGDAAQSPGGRRRMQKAMKAATMTAGSAGSIDPLLPPSQERVVELEAENAQLRVELERVTRERDLYRQFDR